MFCKHCGHEVNDNAIICPNCGVATDNMTPAVPITATPQKGVNGFAIAGLVLGIVGLLGGNYAFLIPGIVGLILSIVGMVKSKQYAAPGLALAALIVSIIAFLIWVIIWIACFALLIAAIIGAAGGPY